MDVVITYVNGADKSWQASYAQHVKKPIEEARYRDWGTMPYLVRGIRKYMTYIDKIFIVVADASQVPAGVDLKDVRIIYHKDIIPEKYLPCFNSDAIEMFLYKIPELSEQFIYFNDDMFVLQPTEETDFFVDGKPVLAPKLVKYNAFDTFGCYLQHCINVTDILVNTFKLKSFPKNTYIVQEHRMRPFLKSSCEKVWENCSDAILHSLTRVRHERNFNAYLFNNYDYLMGNYVMKLLSFKMVCTINPLSYICNCIINSQSKFLCLNDNDAINFSRREQIQNAFNTNLIMETPNISNTCNKDTDITVSKNTDIQEKNIKVAICAIAKNENLYIREWVEYYKKIGINKIFLYDNNDIDGERFEDVINDYIQNGFVKIIDYRGIWPSQVCAYDEFYHSSDANEYDWILYIDIDEFLELEDKTNNIHNLLSSHIYDKYDAIKLCWKYFDDNDLTNVVNKNYSVNRFTHYNDEPINNGQTKQIIRTGLNTNINSPHGSINKISSDEVLTSNIKCCDILGNYNAKNTIWINNREEGGIHKIAWINHYRFKTMEEYITKAKRGWATTYQNGGHTYMGIKFFYRFNKQTDEKDKIFNKLFCPYTYTSCTDSNKIIISLTSYPKRIGYVKNVLDSLIFQTVDNNLYHIVLTLSIIEFPAKEYNLPKQLVEYIQKHSDMIEILWVERNTRSHKKLMPVLNKYPNNYILIIDDDICRPKIWLSKFIEDKTKYPTDIITGACKTRLDSQFRNVPIMFKNHDNGHGHYGVDEPGKILTSERPANGYGGTLYPPHTFNDSRFFDESLYMKLVPSSDEMWQYCFNVIENKTIRTLSYFFDYETYVIKESQYSALWKENNNNYDNMYQILFKEFPEFKKNMIERIQHAKY